MGSDFQNYQIKNLAEIVANSMSKRPAIDWYGDPDKRSYQVSFAKAKEILGFEAKHNPAEAVQEIEAALLQGRVRDEMKTKTLEWYKHLLSDEQASKDVILRGAIL
jgi:hypothetical protein